MKKSIYLLNWSVPLLRDAILPEGAERLCEHQVEPCAPSVFQELAKSSQLFIMDGDPNIDQTILQRSYDGIQLSRYVSGYFCAANVQLQKGTPAFILRAMMLLNASPAQITVVGEDYQQDILPALLLGLRAIWLDNSERPAPNAKVTKISHISELVGPLKLEQSA